MSRTEVHQSKTTAYPARGGRRGEEEEAREFGEMRAG